METHGSMFSSSFMARDFCPDSTDDPAQFGVALLRQRETQRKRQREREERERERERGRGRSSDIDVVATGGTWWERERETLIICVLDK